MDHSPDQAPAPVLIDASALSSVASSSGVGTYVRGLLAGLAALPASGVSVRALATAGVALPPGVEGRAIRRRVKHRARAEVMEHALMLPLDVQRRRAAGEVFHEPNFHAPWGIGGPRVQTLHDIIPLVFDSPDVGALRQRWRRFGPRYATADAVIAVSHHAADEGIRVLGLDPKKVHVAHHGVSASFRPDGHPPADPPFLLLVGEYSRRKGFGAAFAVVDALADAGYRHTLKVAGRVHDHSQDELAELRESTAHPERIQILGLVDDLEALYRRATVVLNTSRYEGFGLPAVEAMASGVPVVAFANSAVTEVVDGGGILVADGDVGAMTAAVRTIVDSPAAAEEWRERGLQRAACFTWANSAEIHAEVYRLVAGKR